MLKIEHLSFFQILQDISLELKPGTITFLMGKSGAGKTTLLRCIAQLEKKYQGNITYQNKPLKHASPQERSQIVGFVSQNYTLFPHLSVRDNCSQPLRLLKKNDEKVDQILNSLDISDLVTRLPHQLSGGQQQRVALAQALVLDPQYFLFDEPTSALDGENTELFYKIILQLKSEGKGILISTHDTTFTAKFLEPTIKLL